MKTKTLVQSLIEAARCLGTAQAGNDEYAVDHWRGQVDSYTAQLKARDPDGQGENHRALGAVLDRAARELPQGYFVNVTVEKDAGWAELECPEGSIVGSDDGGDLAEQVSWAIAFAVEHATEVPESGDG